MKDVIKEKYSDKAIVYSNMRLYFISTAKEIVEDCRKRNIKIFGLEALKLTGEGIQPSQEYSIDFSGAKESWDEAIKFLSNIKDTSFLYEIFYENY